MCCVIPKPPSITCVTGCMFFCPQLSFTDESKSVTMNKYLNQLQTWVSITSSISLIINSLWQPCVTSSISFVMNSMAIIGYLIHFSRNEFSTATWAPK